MATDPNTGSAFSIDRDEVGIPPAFAEYTIRYISRDLWLRPELTRRDRFLVTLAALITNSQQIGMHYYFDSALDEGVTAAEVSELVVHIAFCSSWPNTVLAVGVLKAIFTQREISDRELPVVAPLLLDIDPDLDVHREFLGEQIGYVAPRLRRHTDDLLYRDVWRRPGLSSRDRFLVTMSALMASKQNELVPSYVTGCLNQGVTRAQIAEVVTHLAFYAGWARAISAAGVIRQLFAPSAASGPDESPNRLH